MKRILSKRPIALLLSLIFLLSTALTACGSSSSQSTTTPQQSSTAQSPGSAENAASSSRTLEGGYVIPEGTLVTASAQSEKKFIFNMANLYVVPGYDVVYLDEYEFDLGHKAIATEDDKDVYLALEDLAKIYGPDFKMTEKDGGIEIAHAGLTATVKTGNSDVSATNGTFSMDYPVQEIDGVLCVPVLQFMERAFGKYISSQETTGWDTSDCAEGKYEFNKYKSVPMTIYAISNHADGSISDSGNVYTSVVTAMKNKLRGAKDYGIVYKAFYDEKVDKCITTELYVPTSLYFNPSQELSCVVVFPGAGGTAGNYNSTKDNTSVDVMHSLQFYAEEHNYVLITVESYINSGQYGDPTGPIGRFPVTHPEDPENPWGKSDGWMADIHLSGEVVIDTLDFVLDSYPSINENKVYAFGHSMGSMGVTSMGVNYTDRFSALVASGGFTEFDYWDITPIGNMPFLFMGGTEDSNGLDYMFYGIERYQQLFPNFEYKFVGGAVHNASWMPYAEAIFQWLDQVGA